MLDRIESHHLDRIAELSRQEVGNDSLDVSPLGLASGIVWRMWSGRFDNHID